jgi:UDP-N-acetylmuramoyl-tripeptide--D-alanyl-D-alanine ligase
MSGPEITPGRARPESGSRTVRPPAWMFAEVALLSGGTLQDPAAADRAFDATQISTDTRTLRPRDFFVALRGENHDGHAHLAGAAVAGACGAMVDRPAGPPGLPVVLVEDTTAGLQRWAAEHRRRFPAARVVGLTGSSGKTTAKDLLTHLLSGEAPVLATAGNLNNHLGVPRTLLGLGPDHRYAVVEMGMNHPGEISLLSRLAGPEAALITDVGTAHVGYLGSREAILAAKLEIIDGMSAAAPLVLPHDRWVLDRLPASVRSRPLITFGLDPAADWHPDGPVEMTLDGTRFTTRQAGPVELSLLGPGSALSALAALAGVEALGGDAAALVARLGNAARRPLRMEPRRLGGNDWILDCYNASPESTRLAIGFLREVPHAGRRLLVLGALGELGDQAESIHRELGERAGAVETVLFVGEGARPAFEANRAAALSSATAAWVQDTDEAAAWLRPRLRAGDLVLLKGSRRTGLERIVTRLYPSEDVAVDRAPLAPGGDKGGRDGSGGPGDRRRSR